MITIVSAAFVCIVSAQSVGPVPIPMPGEGELDVALRSYEEWDARAQVRLGVFAEEDFAVYQAYRECREQTDNGGRYRNRFLAPVTVSAVSLSVLSGSAFAAVTNIPVGSVVVGDEEYSRNTMMVFTQGSGLAAPMVCSNAVSKEVEVSGYEEGYQAPDKYVHGHWTGGHWVYGEWVEDEWVDTSYLRDTYVVEPVPVHFINVGRPQEVWVPDLRGEYSSEFDENGYWQTVYDQSEVDDPNLMVDKFEGYAYWKWQPQHFDEFDQFVHGDWVYTQLGTLTGQQEMYAQGHDVPVYTQVTIPGYWKSELGAQHWVDDARGPEANYQEGDSGLDYKGYYTNEVSEVWVAESLSDPHGTRVEDYIWVNAHWVDTHWVDEVPAVTVTNTVYEYWVELKAGNEILVPCLPFNKKEHRIECTGLTSLMTLPVDSTYRLSGHFEWDPWRWNPTTGTQGGFYEWYDADVWQFIPDDSNLAPLDLARFVHPLLCDNAAEILGLPGEDGIFYTADDIFVSTFSQGMHTYRRYGNMLDSSYAEFYDKVTGLPRYYFTVYAEDVLTKPDGTPYDFATGTILCYPDNDLQFLPGTADRMPVVKLQEKVRLFPGNSYVVGGAETVVAFQGEFDPITRTFTEYPHVNVTFMADGNTVLDTVKYPSGFDYGTLPEPQAQAGEWFLNWRTEGGAAVSTADIVPDTDVTLYAVYTTESVTVMFDGVGSQTFAVGKPYGTLPVPSYDPATDYFVGWSWDLSPYYHSLRCVFADTPVSADFTLLHPCFVDTDRVYYLVNTGDVPNTETTVYKGAPVAGNEIGTYTYWYGTVEVNPWEYTWAESNHTEQAVAAIMEDCPSLGTVVIVFGDGESLYRADSTVTLNRQAPWWDAPTHLRGRASFQEPYSYVNHSNNGMSLKVESGIVFMDMDWNSPNGAIIASGQGQLVINGGNIVAMGEVVGIAALQDAHVEIFGGNILAGGIACAIGASGVDLDELFECVDGGDWDALSRNMGNASVNITGGNLSLGGVSGMIATMGGSVDVSGGTFRIAATEWERAFPVIAMPGVPHAGAAKYIPVSWFANIFSSSFISVSGGEFIGGIMAYTSMDHVLNVVRAGMNLFGSGDEAEFLDTLPASNGITHFFGGTFVNTLFNIAVASPEEFVALNEGGPAFKLRDPDGVQNILLTPDASVNIAGKGVFEPTQRYSVSFSTEEDIVGAVMDIALRLGFPFVEKINNGEELTFDGLLDDAVKYGHAFKNRLGPNAQVVVKGGARYAECFIPPAPYEHLAFAVSGDDLIYAFEKAEFFWNMGGGDSETVWQGATYILPGEVPENSGWVLHGWNSQPDGLGDWVTAKTRFTEDSPRKLYAQWTDNVITVNFYDDSEYTTLLYTRQYDENQVFGELPPLPTHGGFLGERVYVGWNLPHGYQIATPEMPVRLALPPLGDTTIRLFARSYPAHYAYYVVNKPWEDDTTIVYKDKIAEGYELGEYSTDWNTQENHTTLAMRAIKEDRYNSGYDFYQDAVIVFGDGKSAYKAYAALPFDYHTWTYIHGKIVNAEGSGMEFRNAAVVFIDADVNMKHATFDVAGIGTEVHVSSGSLTLYNETFAIRVSSGAKLTFNGGTVTAGGALGAFGVGSYVVGNSFADEDTRLTINGGTFNLAGLSAVTAFGTPAVEINGGAFRMDAQKWRTVFPALSMLGVPREAEEAAPVAWFLGAFGEPTIILRGGTFEGGLMAYASATPLASLIRENHYGSEHLTWIRKKILNRMLEDETKGPKTWVGIGLDVAFDNAAANIVVANPNETVALSPGATLRLGENGMQNITLTTNTFVEALGDRGYTLKNPVTVGFALPEVITNTIARVAYDLVQPKVEQIETDPFGIFEGDVVGDFWNTVAPMKGAGYGPNGQTVVREGAEFWMDFVLAGSPYQRFNVVDRDLVYGIDDGTGDFVMEEVVIFKGNGYRFTDGRKEWAVIQTNGTDFVMIDSGEAIPASWAGYGFLGWNTDRKGAGEWVADYENTLFAADGEGATPRVFYAVWEEPETYTVVLDATGADDNPIQYVTVTYGKPMPDLNERLHRDGYTFLGFTNDVGKAYYVTTQSACDWDVHGGGTLYAVWMDYSAQVAFACVEVEMGMLHSKYIVTGDPVVQIFDVADVEDPLYLSPATPVHFRQGYTFLGWRHFETRDWYQYGMTLSPGRDGHIFLAQWVELGEDQYIVTLDGNGGDPALQYVVATYGEPLPSLRKGTVPYLEGYTFCGFTNSAGKAYYVSSQSVCDWDVQGGGTLYAVWMDTAAQVAFVCVDVELVENEENPRDSTVKYIVTGDPVAQIFDVADLEVPLFVNPVTPTPFQQGHVFVGWKHARTGEMYYPGMTLPQESVHYFFAQWVELEDDEYLVTLDATGGYPALQYVVATYGEPMPTLGKGTVPYLEGYTFCGFTNSAGKAYYVSSQSVCDWDVHGGGTLYAVWMDTAAQVAFVCVDVERGEDTNMKMGIARTKYIVTGDPVAQIFDVADLEAPLYVNPVTPTPVQQGHVFVGWKHATTGEMYYPGMTLPQESQHYFLAQWVELEDDEYLVTLDGNGGEPALQYVIATYGEPLPSLWKGSTARMPYHLEEYDCLGFTNSVGKAYYMYGLGICDWDVEGDDTLYAVWFDLQSQVAFVCAEIYGREDIECNGEPVFQIFDVADFGAPLTVDPVMPEHRRGYPFLAWTHMQAGVEYVKGETTLSEIEGDSYYHIFLAVWDTPPKHEVILDASDADGFTSQTAYAICGEPMPVRGLEVPPRDGFLCLGFTNAVGEVYYTVNYEGEVATLKSHKDWDVEGTGTLYAMWMEMGAQAVFYGNGGEPVVQIFEIVNDEVIDFNLVMPVREGYAFLGWRHYETGELFDGWVSFGDAFYLAKWQKLKKNQYIVTLDGNGGDPSTQYIVATYGKPMPDVFKKGSAAEAQWPTLTIQGDVPSESTSAVGFTNSVGKIYYMEGKSVCDWDVEGDDTLYAAWCDQSSQVIFICMEFDSETPDYTIVGDPAFQIFDVADFEAPLDVTPVTPVHRKEGYSFVGWKQYETGDLYYPGMTLPQKSRHVFVAQWVKLKKDQYIVTLDGNGGPPALQYIVVTYGKPMPDVFKKGSEGQARWPSITVEIDEFSSRSTPAVGFTNSVGKIYYMEGRSVCDWDVQGDDTLYAAWFDRTSQVGFACIDLDDETRDYTIVGDPAFQIVGVADLEAPFFANLVAPVHREAGYGFVGWKHFVTEEMYYPGMTLPQLEDEFQNQIFIAQWVELGEDEYIVTLDATGADTYPIQYVTVTYGQPMPTNTVNNPQWENNFKMPEEWIHFIGFTNSVGKMYYMSGGDSDIYSTSDWDVESDDTLYAVWWNPSTQVMFMGISIGEGGSLFAGTPSMQIFDVADRELPLELEPVNPVHPQGYAFLGWKHWRSGEPYEYGVSILPSEYGIHRYLAEWDIPEDPTPETDHWVFISSFKMGADGIITMTWLDENVRIANPDYRFYFSTDLTVPVDQWLWISETSPQWLWRLDAPVPLMTFANDNGINTVTLNMNVARSAYLEEYGVQEDFKQLFIKLKALEKPPLKEPDPKD